MSTEAEVLSSILRELDGKIVDIATRIWSQAAPLGSGILAISADERLVLNVKAKKLAPLLAGLDVHTYVSEDNKYSVRVTLQPGFADVVTYFGLNQYQRLKLMNDGCLIEKLLQQEEEDS